MGESIRLPQTSDTPAFQVGLPEAALTLLYDRARDSKQANAPGQDYLACDYDAGWLAFAVCDGVSQSFYGDLAAKFLGEKLVEWFAVNFWLPGATSAGRTPEILSAEFATMLDDEMRSWVAEGRAIAANKHIPETLAPLVQDALHRKRAYGSESMFVAGRVDFAAGWLSLCWMGDSRIALWDVAGRPIAFPADVWQRRERWSTESGPRHGAVRGLILPLAGIARITAFTDGILPRAETLATAISPARLDETAAELLQEPASDDIALLDIDLMRPAEGQPPDVIGILSRIPAPPPPVIVPRKAAPLPTRAPVRAPVVAASRPVPPPMPPPPKPKPVRPEPSPRVPGPVPGPRVLPEFRLGPVLLLALLLALVGAVVWYMQFLAPLR